MGAIGSKQYVAQGSGTTWTGAVVGLPANAYSHPHADAYAVACATPTGCVAVGNYVSTSGLFETVLDVET